MKFPPTSKQSPPPLREAIRPFSGKENLADQQRLNRRDSNGKSGFNGGSNEGKIDPCLPGGWTRSDHSGMQVLKHSDDGCSCGREPGKRPPLGLRIRFGSRSLCKCLSAAFPKKLWAYDGPQERGFIGRLMAATGFDPETDVGASKDKGQPICWPHRVSPLAPASTATPPLRCSASVVLHCAPQ
jgi:hypothetical protein